jgi:hypothetical protein
MRIMRNYRETVSRRLVAEYSTRMPDKKLLQAKLHEFYALAESQAAPSMESPAAASPPPIKPGKSRKK